MSYVSNFFHRRCPYKRTSMCVARLHPCDAKPLDKHASRDNVVSRDGTLTCITFTLFITHPLPITGSKNHTHPRIHRVPTTVYPQFYPPIFTRCLPTILSAVYPPIFTLIRNHTTICESTYPLTIFNL